MPSQLWGGDNEVQRVIDEARSAHIEGRTKPVEVDTTTVTIRTPFPSPVDWRDSWIYFLMVDRFNNPNAPPKQSYDSLEEIFQGGTIEGVRQQLAYLERLGAGAIWLSPVLKNCQYRHDSYHGYGIQDFLTIDPRFASDPAHADEELRRLVDEAHARNMYVIFDIVLNHAGDVFAYKDYSDNDKENPVFRKQPSYPILWRDQNGERQPKWSDLPKNETIPPDAAVWPKELQHNEFFRRRGKAQLGDDIGDFFKHKELVTIPYETEISELPYTLLDVLIRIHQYLIAAYDLDGFRVDTLKHLELEFVRQFCGAIREFAAGIGKPNFFIFGEIFSTNEQFITSYIGGQTLEHIGVDAVLDFPLANHLTDTIKSRNKAPSDIAQMFNERKKVQSNVISSHAEAGRYFVTFLDNHDWRYYDKHERFYAQDKIHPIFDEKTHTYQLILGLSCLFTLQGIPCVYYGTEQGLNGIGYEDERIREALWGKANAFDEDHQFYRELQQIATLRRNNPVLRYGRQYFRQTSDDGKGFKISKDKSTQIAFSRISNDQELVIVANVNDSQTNWEGMVLIDSGLNAEVSSHRILYSNKEHSGDETVPVRIVENALIDELGPDDIPHYARILALKVVLRPMEIQVLGPQV
jgi:glycosidase